MLSDSFFRLVPFLLGMGFLVWRLVGAEVDCFLDCFLLPLELLRLALIGLVLAELALGRERERERDRVLEEAMGRVHGPSHGFHRSKKDNSIVFVVLHSCIKSTLRLLDF